LLANNRLRGKSFIHQLIQERSVLAKCITSSNFVKTIGSDRAFEIIVYLRIL